MDDLAESGAFPRLDVKMADSLSRVIEGKAARQMRILEQKLIEEDKRARFKKVKTKDIAEE